MGKMNGLGADFRKLWAGSAVSNLGDGVTFVAIPLLAATLTDSPELVAGLSFAYTLPRLLAATFSGVAADRMDLRLSLTVANLSRGALLGFLALLVWLDLVSLWALYGVFALMGVLETLADVSAFSVLPALVERRELDRANGRLAGAQTVCDEIAGPPLGGLLFGIAAALPILFDASTFILAAACFWWIRGDLGTRTLRDEPRPGVLQEAGKGLRFLAGQPLLRTFAAMSVLTNIAYMLPFSVIVLYATRILGLSPAGYGTALTVSAVGSLLGSFAAPAIRRFLGTGLTIGGMLLLGAGAYAVIALTRSVVLVTTMLAVYFFYTTVWSITFTSVRQAITPPELLGRVAGATRTFSLLGLLVGALGGGFVAGAFGLRAPFWCAAALLMLTSTMIRPLLTPPTPATDSVQPAPATDPDPASGSTVPSP